MQKQSSKSYSQSIKYWSSFAVAFLLRFKGLILMGLFLGVVLFLVSNKIAPRFLSRSHSRIGVTGRYHPDELPTYILEDISDGLTVLSRDGVVEPNIAQSWETPDKGKTWIFHLGESVEWQDGTPLISEDITYQFSDVLIERPDDKTVVFKLNDAFSPFPSVLSRPIFKSGFLGTGEWRVVNVSLAGEFVQNMTMEDDVGNRKTYKFFPSEDQAKLAYKMGYVDLLEYIIDPKPIDTWNTVRFEEVVNKNQVVTLFYNNDDQLFSANKELRQALNYAIDKGMLGERALSPIPPNSWVYNPQVKPYDYNIERAKEIMGENIPDEQIKLVTTPVLLDVAEKISEDWKALGIDSVVQVSSVIPTDYQVYLAILDVPKDPDQYSIWHSTQKESTNISKFGNVRIDKLLEDGRIELDLEARRRIYIDFQRFIVEDLPAAFLYHPITYNIHRK